MRPNGRNRPVETSAPGNGAIPGFAPRFAVGAVELASDLRGRRDHESGAPAVVRPVAGVIFVVVIRSPQLVGENEQAAYVLAMRPSRPAARAKLHSQLGNQAWPAAVPPTGMWRAVEIRGLAPAIKPSAPLLGFLPRLHPCCCVRAGYCDTHTHVLTICKQN